MPNSIQTHANRKLNDFCSVAKPKSLEGPLAVNTLLDNSERLFEGKLDSPENLQHRDGVIYATLRSNEVVKITGEKIETLTSFGKSCCE
jgi:hypothetical protein